MEFGYTDTILLGFIQGITEFLPISSSGHLIVGKSILEVKELPLVFDVFYHFATLLSIIFYYRDDLINLTLNGFKSITVKPTDSDLEELLKIRKFIIYLIIATIPAVIIGLLFEDYLKSFFTSSKSVSLFFVFTGLILLSTKFINEKKSSFSNSRSLAIGFAQSVALFPGISRSGSTIACAF